MVTSANIIAGLELALSQADAMIERQQHVMQRAIDAWDTTTHKKSHDGQLWQCMEELRGECGKQPNYTYTETSNVQVKAAGRRPVAP